MVSRGDIHKVVGKTIAGVIVKRSITPTSPAHQIYLIFSDNTTCEFYTDESEIYPSFTFLDYGQVREISSDVMEIKMDHVDTSLLEKR